MGAPPTSSGPASSGAGTRSRFLWPSLSAEGLGCLSASAPVLADPYRAVWFPEYGCALLALPVSTPTAPATEAPVAVAEKEAKDIRARLPELSLVLVGLDDWSFRIHK